MRTIWVLLLLAFFKSYASQFTRPRSVRIGSVLTYDSVIGKVAKVAIEAAVDDVNSNPNILKGTDLKVTMIDSQFSGFSGIIEAIRFMETEAVAIIGPQSSVTAHVVSYIANELHVPLLSFSATDPTLSPLQFPYFIRTSVNDLFQMAAIGDIVKYYGWREVITIYTDDDYGRNGIDILADQLAARSCRISYKAPLKSRANLDGIRDVLVQVALAGSRVIIVHTYPDIGLDIMSTAQYLGMLDKGYVWIATNWLSTLLDSNAPLSQDKIKNIQGVLSLRIYIPETKSKKKFVSRWSNFTSDEVTHGPIGLSTYGLYAYDTVWLLARAIEVFLQKGGNTTFTADSRLKEFRKGTLGLNSMSIFNGGDLLLRSILNVSMIGVTGPFEFTSDRNLINPAFEVINVIGTGFRKTGYWTNYSGLSISLPEIVYSRPPNHSSASQRLYPVVWPGQTTDTPRGWVFPQNGRLLKIGVPSRVSFRDFVSHVPGTEDKFTGYCIDVFNAAISLLPYAVPFQLVPHGDGHNNPNSTELVRLITTGVYDAAIGDIAIITSRTRMADFTQPFIESGLVVVAPVRKLHSSAWAFLRPFNREMWCATGVFFLVIGAVVWILEHRINDDFRGPPRKQVVTIIWFSFSTLFSTHRENTVSTLGRLVLLLWLFVVLIINSSYTASLTSILTVQQLSSDIKGLETLLKNNDPIGYQQGSFTHNYLVEELGIHESRLVPLKLPEDYAKALKDGPGHGGVAAVIDESAYIELFLSTRCEFSTVGRQFTKNGWGFAFSKDSPLAEDMSTAILKLSEAGDLQRIHDKWLLKSACSSQGAKLEVDRLSLTSFEGLFFICGLACIIALLVYLVKLRYQYNRYCSQFEPSGQRSGRLGTFLTFANEKEETIKARSIRMQPEWASSNKSIK